MKKCPPRYPVSFWEKFNGSNTPKVYDMDFEYFKKKCAVRKETGSTTYPMNHFEISVQGVGFEVDASLSSLTPVDGLLEIYSEIQDTLEYYKQEQP